MHDPRRGDAAAPLLRTTLISALGGVFEFYDFVIFAVFAPQIGAAFFPPEAGESAQTLKAFLVFAVGYLARPIGGILWAHVADRRGPRGPGASPRGQRHPLHAELLRSRAALGAGLCDPRDSLASTGRRCRS